jgi:ABC-type branched-subunit amino acid transport system ATPase component/ABC-type branched-subunit amino acid transport system permease subunit
MANAWQFFLLGLGLATPYVLLGQSVVLVFRGSGVVNFASGVFAQVGAYTYYELCQAGVPIIVALIGGIAVGALVGALTYQLVVRPLLNTAPLVKVIATLGVQIVIVEALSLHYGNDVSFPLPLFGNSDVHIFGATIGSYVLAMFGLAIVLTAGLWAVYRFTMFGLKTSAVAENRRALAALGHSPQAVGLANWAFGGAIAALAGIIVTPTLGLSVSGLALLTVPALAVCLPASFRSFWLVLIGGLVLGVGQSELTTWVGAHSWGFGWPQAFPFLVIVVVMVFRGRSLPERSFVSARLPAVGNGRLSVPIVLIAACAGVLLIALLPRAGAEAMTASLAGGIILLSFVVVTGYAGQLSLAQVGLAGLGAFFAARLSDSWGLGFWPALLCGVVLIVPVGVLVGTTALRSRGVNLAIVTLGLGLVINDVVLGSPTYSNGITGLAVKAPSLFGLSLEDALFPRRYAYLCLALFIVAGLLVANLRRGRVGRHLVAVRSNERAAASLGIELTTVKVYAFVIAACVAALGGILLAFQNSYVELGTGFDPLTSVNFLSFAVIGGLGYISGAPLGAQLIPFGIAAWLGDVIFGGESIQTWITLFAGVGLITILLMDPDGLASSTIKAARAHRDGRLPKWAYLRPEVLLISGWTFLERRAQPMARRFRPEPEGAHAPAEGEGQTFAVTPGRLDINDLGVRFGGVVAVDGVSLSVSAGEVVGLIGPNGAGKTALIDAATGMTARYSGTVVLNDTPLEGLSPSKRSRLGMGRSFQAPELFEDLTVIDNLRAASDQPTWQHYMADLVAPTTPPLPAAVLAAIQEFGLEDCLDSKPTELPFGTRRLVGIARAVAYQPSVLLLDEPASGLDDRETRELIVLLRKLADHWGFAILLVEHDMNVIMTVCDRVTVLNFGKTIATGTPGEIAENPAVIEAYLGVTSEPVASHGMLGDLDPERSAPSGQA